MPHFQHSFETAGPDLAVIAVNTGFNDTLDAVSRYRQQLGITMPIVLDDGTLAHRFNLRVTPTHIIIGRDGRIQYVGHLADSSVDEALAAAKAGQPRQPSGSRAADAGSSSTATEIKAIAVGDPLPPRVVRTVAGRTLPLRETADGKITAILFFSPWCESYLATSRPEVSAECRSIREQVTALADRSDIRWIGIASGLWANRDDLLKYQADYHVAVPVALDASGTIFREFRVNDVPTLILADSKGRVMRRLDPQGPGQDDVVRSSIDALAGPR
jgi:hypothetical protein